MLLSDDLRRLADARLSLIRLSRSRNPAFSLLPFALSTRRWATKSRSLPPSLCRARLRVLRDRSFLLVFSLFLEPRDRHVYPCTSC